MEFRDDLKVAADLAVEQQRNTADHTIRQAFFAGVAFYMEWLKKNSKTSSDPPSVS